MASSEKPFPCPNCETEMEMGDGDGNLLCPVCTFKLQPCPECGGLMGKKVEAPDGVEIGEGGLPLAFCVAAWICLDPACGHRIDSED